MADYSPRGHITDSAIDDNLEWVRYSIRQIQADFGVPVSVSTKAKSLTKFGRSTDIDTAGSTAVGLP